jgi:hypothetical protein
MSCVAAALYFGGYVSLTNGIFYLPFFIHYEGARKILQAISEGKSGAAWRLGYRQFCGSDFLSRLEVGDLKSK